MNGLFCEGQVRTVHLENSFLLLQDGVFRFHQDPGHFLSGQWNRPRSYGDPTDKLGDHPKLKKVVLIRRDRGRVLLGSDGPPETQAVFGPDPFLYNFLDPRERSQEDEKDVLRVEGDHFPIFAAAREGDFSSFHDIEESLLNRLPIHISVPSEHSAAGLADLVHFVHDNDPPGSTFHIPPSILKEPLKKRLHIVPDVTRSRKPGSVPHVNGETQEFAGCSNEVRLPCA